MIAALESLPSAVKGGFGVSGVLVVHDWGGLLVSALDVGPHLSFDPDIWQNLHTHDILQVLYTSRAFTNAGQ